MTPESKQPGYVLITPARNEENFIAQVIDSVVAQTIRPLRWVIVNDASNDATHEIALSRTFECDFVRLVNLKRQGQRDFARKAFAFGEGLRLVDDLNYQFIGNLDADICLPRDYYERMLKRFTEEPDLGIAGGIVYTRIGDRFLTSDANPRSVGGAVQLFRKECFEAIGGYMPLKHGGIDAAAEIKARMYGWRVQKFFDCKVTELRRTGSAEANPIKARVREGQRFHSLGYSLLFYLVRAVYRMKDPPVIVGSLAALYGFLRSRLKREPIQLPQDVVTFLRQEQVNQLKNRCKKLFPFQGKRRSVDNQKVRRR